LYSIITLLSNDLYKQRKFRPRTAAWYTKTGFEACGLRAGYPQTPSKLSVGN
jgi:hypothetical protein